MAAIDSAPEGSPGQLRYAAFASYSTDPDYHLVRKVESFLESFHRLRTPDDVHLKRLEICVDSSSFPRPRTASDSTASAAENPIRKLIDARLAEAENLLVFCSRNARTSPWVNDEIEWFLENRDPDSVLLAVTEGDDPTHHPEEVFPERVLQAVLHRKPWYDFRGCRREARGWTKVRDLEDEMVQLAAHLNNLTSEQVQPLWQREQRRRLRRNLILASTVAIFMAGLAVVAFILWQLAESRARINAAQHIATGAKAVQRQAPQRSLLLAVEAMRIPWPRDGRVPEVEQNLRDSLSFLGGWGLTGHQDSVDCVAVSPDQRWLATGGGPNDRTVRLWDLRSNYPNQSPRILQGHLDWVGAIAFSPDSRWLVTAAGFRTGFLRSNDHRALVWDLRDQQALRESRPSRVLANHDGEVSVITFSPDGRQLATGSGDAKVRIWDVQGTGPGQDCRLLEKHQDEISKVVFSQDGQQALTASRDGVAIRWDLSTRTAQKVIAQSKRQYYTVGVSADLRWVAVAGNDGAVRLWDLEKENLTKPWSELPIEKAPTFVLAFSRDSRWLVTAPGFTSQFGAFERFNRRGLQDYRTTRLWDLKAAVPSVPFKVIPGGENPVYAAQFTPDSRWLVTAGGEGSVQLWDLQDTDASAVPITLPSHDGAVWALDVTDRWLASGGLDRTARVWTLAHLESPSWPRFLAGHASGVRHIALSPDEHWLATGTVAGMVHLWDLTKNQLEDAPTMLAGEGRVIGLRFTDTFERLMVAHSDGRVDLWQLPVGHPRQPDSILTGPVSRGTHLAATPNGRLVAVAGSEKGVCLWQPDSREPARRLRLLDTKGAQIWSLAVSPNGLWVIAGDQAGNVHLWDLRGDPVTPPHTTLSGHEQTFEAIAFSPDSRWAVTASWDHTARIWDLESPHSDQSVRVLRGHSEPLTAVAVTPDRRWVVTGSRDRSVRLWRLQDADPSRTAIVLRGHEGAIGALAVSPDSQWLLSSSEDRTGRLWELGAGAPVVPSSVIVVRHRDAVEANNLGRQWVVTGSRDGTAGLAPLGLGPLLDAVPLVVGRNLRHGEWTNYFPARPYRPTFPGLPDPGE